MFDRAHKLFSIKTLGPCVALAAITFAFAPASAAAEITDADIASFGETSEISEAEQPKLTGQTPFYKYMLRLTISLGVVIGLIAIAARFGKKYLPAQVSGGRTGAIEVLASRSLGGRKNLLLVRVQEKTVLLGVGPQNIQFLTDLDEGAGAWDHAAAGAGLGDLVAVRKEPGT